MSRTTTASYKRSILIFGLGYVGLYFKTKLEELGIETVGTKSNSHKDDVFTFNEDNKLDLSVINKATHILVTIPPINGKDLVLEHHLPDLLASSNLKWIGYLSSTGVYGNHNGNWVTEESELKAQDKDNLDRIAIEKQWAESGLEPVIFRLSGIYGPDRSALDSIISGKFQRIFKEQQFFSRIHVEDIVQIIINSMELSIKGETLNLADDNPSAQYEPYDYVLEKLGLQKPEMVAYDKANLSERMKIFFDSSKKVSNQKLKELLGYKFIYKNYKDGLTKILEDHQNNNSL
jgi:nucleoside-diphosphate-sugar epimerase